MTNPRSSGSHSVPVLSDHKVIPNMSMWSVTSSVTCIFNLWQKEEIQTLTRLLSNSFFMHISHFTEELQELKKQKWHLKHWWKGLLIDITARSDTESGSLSLCAEFSWLEGSERNQSRLGEVEKQRGMPCGVSESHRSPAWPGLPFPQHNE